MGTHTLRALTSRGYETLNYDLKEGYDIRNIDQLRSVVEEGDKILHLAAIARFREAEENPVLAYQTNVGGSANVFRAAAEKKAERVVHASTGSVYMPVWASPISEDHPVSGNSHYGFSKALAEKMLLLHRVPFVVLRYAHLYGKGKYGHGAIGGFIERMERGLRPVLFGGYQSNDFCYVLDVVQANLAALETPHTNEYFNIGTGYEMTTEDAFEIIRNVTNYQGEFEYRPIRGVDASRFVYDISKAQRLLNYKPEYDLKRGLEHMFSEGGSVWQA